MRRNFRTAKRISMGARPLESVIKYNKLGVEKSRNKEEEGNRTKDDFDKDPLGDDMDGCK